MTSYQYATLTPACIRLYLDADRSFLFAERIDNGHLWGVFDGEWWSA